MDITQLSNHYSSTGQITLNDLQAIKQLGFKTIICFRPPAEDKENQINQEDLKNEALKNNLVFLNIPVIPGNITPENVATFTQEMSSQQTPFLVIVKVVVALKECTWPTSKVKISNKA